MVILGIAGAVLALIVILLAIINVGADIYLWLEWFFTPPGGRKRD